jgi:hypothetical protein
VNAPFASPCVPHGEGDHAKHGGGVAGAELIKVARQPPDSEPSTPPPPFGWSPSPSAMGRIKVGDALRAFRTANGLCQNEREARWWIVRADLIVFPLPNFAWRRRAIDAHDVHHLLTGYPCSCEGEVLIAAWEWGAGRYPHWGATLFCLPIVIAGLLFMPGPTLAAWRRGRRSRSLYRHADLDHLADLPLALARALIRD